jgi:hypothetical protein
MPLVAPIIVVGGLLLSLHVEVSLMLLQLYGFVGDLPWYWWVGLAVLFVLIVIFIVMRRQSD